MHIFNLLNLLNLNVVYNHEVKILTSKYVVILQIYL